jgi:uncharacterized membrane protein YfhO
MNKVKTKKIVHILEKQYSQVQTVTFLLSLFTLIFIVLYNKYFTRYIYAFYDIGCDTFQSYYPTYYLAARSLLNGNWSYVLECIGGGISTFSLISIIADPFILLSLLVPLEHLNIFIILQVFLKMLTICFFSYLYFSTHLKKPLSKLVASLIWTYSGYIVLWGQHYMFLTTAMYFTIFMFLLDKFIFNQKKYTKWFLIVIAVFCANSVYFLYPSILFAAGYLVYIMLQQGNNAKEIIKKLLWFMLYTLGGMLLSAAVTLPWLEAFLESNRTGGFNTSVLTGFELQRLYFAVLRLFSNNSIGNALTYNGYLNYYEVGMYSTSALIFCALTYHLTNQKTVKKCIIFLLLISASVVFYLPSYIFNLNPASLRWTYMITFIAAFFVGLFLDKIDLLDITPTKLLLGDIVCFGIILLFCGVANRYHKELSFMSLFFSYIAIVIYSLLFVLKIEKKIGSTFVKTSIIILVCFEMVALNYNTVNTRINITNDQVANSYYNDGTANVIQQIKNHDGSYFRINKDYISVFLDDAFVQGYSSTNSYSSINTSTYTNFLSVIGLYPSKIVTPAGNYLYVPSDDFISNTLLGVKYIISKQYSTKPFGFQQVPSSNDLILYENDNNLSFGYTYFNELNQSDVMDLNQFERKIALLSGFFYTDSSLQSTKNTYNTSHIRNIFDAPVARLSGDSGIAPAYYENCNVIKSENGLSILPTTNDPIISFHLEKPIESANGIIITFKLNTEKNNVMEIFWDDSNDQPYYTTEKYAKISLFPGENEYTVGIPANKVSNIRIDPVIDTTPVVISDISLNSHLADQYVSKVRELQKVSLQNTQFRKSILTGEVTNDTGKEGMMCIPYGYSKAWRLKINGEQQEIYNINGGLIGFKLPIGSSKIEIAYKPVTLNIGFNISIISLLIFLAAVVVKKLLHVK